MSRIAIDARELRTSTGRYVERLLHYLQSLDHDNEYMVLLKPADMDWQPANSNFKKVVCPYKEFSFGEQIGFKHQLNKLSVGLVHFPMVQQPAFYRGKVVTTMNDLTTTRFSNPSKNPIIFKFKQLVYRWLNRRVAHKSTELITYSRFVKDDVTKFARVDPDKITVSYLAADKIADEAVPVSGLRPQGFLLYVGRSLPHKNLERLVEAFNQLQAKRPGLKLVLGGKTDANYKRLEAKAQKLGLKNVVFTDFLSEGKLRWLYENCAAYVFPSLSEGFGLPGLEAMLHGAPVVSSDSTCLPEVYGDAAHYFDPLDINAIAAAINEVLTDPKLREELVKRGYERVKKYSWQRMAEQTSEVYLKALS